MHEALRLSVTVSMPHTHLGARTCHIPSVRSTVRTVVGRGRAAHEHPLESCIYISPPRIMHIHTAPSNHAYTYRPLESCICIPPSAPHACLQRISAASRPALGRRMHIARPSQASERGGNLGQASERGSQSRPSHAHHSPPRRWGGRNLLRRSQSPAEAAISWGGRNLLRRPQSPRRAMAAVW